jgi:hypothetical protein
MPKTSSIDAARAAATDLIAALQTPASASPMAGIDSTSLTVLRDLATIFHSSVANKPAPTAAPPAAAPRVQLLPRVEPTPTPSVPIQPVPTLPRVQPTDTYADRTRNPNQHRKQQARTLREIACKPPAESASAIQHRHDTRFQQCQQANALHLQLPSHFANALLDPITGGKLNFRKLIQGEDAKIWILNGCVNEIGRLAQGHAGTDIKGTKPSILSPTLISLLAAKQPMFVLSWTTEIRTQQGPLHRWRQSD